MFAISRRFRFAIFLCPLRSISSLSRYHHRSSHILHNHPRRPIPTRAPQVSLRLRSHRLASLCIRTSFLLFPADSLTPPLAVRRPGHLYVPLFPFSPNPHQSSATIPIAIFAENSSSRRTPLLLGLVALLGAQVLLMEAPNYALMALARALQGISSSMIWVVGLALL